ncbi:UBP1-associated protein 2C-like [Syzygium oleosum]|uniref:UBP1-associated protein 2C-like n=1 Tax=Syzygium oleosum TaxID=219896 RepID=UPI0011D22FB0|nr:UBP1-associated protein 2C-like [Syzygium oleosum]
MDLAKKRKMDGNGVAPSAPSDPGPALTRGEGRRMLESFSQDQLLDLLQAALLRHPDVLSAARSLADGDATRRKLFIRGLGWDTTNDSLRALFSTYGELEEAVVILDKVTGKSKGYGFVTFKHVDGALAALREPSKRIDGRVTVTQLAAAGNSGSSTGNSADVSDRKIYVANVPMDMPADKLLSHFLMYGEIEEGPLGFDKQTGKSRGFALFVYKTAEGAQAALAEPVKTIDGRQLSCKLAIDGKRKPGPAGNVGPGNGHADAVGMSGPGSVPGQYGGPGGMGSYGGFQGPPGLVHLSSGGPGMSAVGSQVHPSLAGTGGYGGGMVAPYGGYGGPGATGYGGAGGALGGVGTGLGGAGGGVGGTSGGLGTAGGSSLYRPSGGYPESGQYGLSSASAYPSQQHQPTGTSPAPRVPPGGMYPNVPSYY